MQEKNLNIEKIGRRIRELREILNLKQTEFAKSLNIAQPYLSVLENGERNSFTIEILLKLVEKYNVNINWLLTGEGRVFLNDYNELENELKKINAEIQNENNKIVSIHKQLREEIKGIPQDTIKEINELRNQVNILIDIIRNLSANYNK